MKKLLAILFLLWTACGLAQVPPGQLQRACSSISTSGSTDVVNYTGSGVLYMAIAEVDVAGPINGSITIVVDGVTYSTQNLSSGPSDWYYLPHNPYGTWPVNTPTKQSSIEFKNSLKVTITSTGSATVTGEVNYAVD